VLSFPHPVVLSGRALNERLRIGFIGTGGRFNTHARIVLARQLQQADVEAAAVCDVYRLHRQWAAERIEKATGRAPQVFEDYRELLQKADVDIVCIATPDHWHGKQILDALAAGKHVYCEKPMTHKVEEALAVWDAWEKSGRVVQIGVQRASDPRWQAAYRFLCEGRIGKVVQIQTEYYRNSRVGQWRYYRLTPEMTPRNINWPKFLGVEEGLAPALPFDRAYFAQWRCYWPFSHGIFSDLFVHRITWMLLATGLRFPRRVVAGGGIFLEYDGRQVPDTVTLVADFDEGVQLVVTATMLNAHPLEHCIRGFLGTVKFDLVADGFDWLPERPQITGTYRWEGEHVTVPRPQDDTQAHWENFLEAIHQGNPRLCNNPPDLGAAATVIALLGAASYRQGKVYEWDSGSRQYKESGPDYAAQWEKLSQDRALPRQIPGWNPQEKDPNFSRQQAPEWQRLAGPWLDDQTDPATL
jgi:predicted dehydrogenase